MTCFVANITQLSNDDVIINQAINILLGRIKNYGSVSLSSSKEVKTFLTLKLVAEEREIFSVIWLDVKNRFIGYEEMFYGTLTHASVYPREIVKRALKHNAAAAILTHNHPSGDTVPSQADKDLTANLRKALALIDVRVLDHIVVAGLKTVSFSEENLL